MATTGSVERVVFCCFGAESRKHHEAALAARRRGLEAKDGRAFPKQPIIVWFRLDLRLADHAALTEAAEAAGAPILPLYILDDETPGRFRAGGASRWWLHGSLEALDERTRQDWAGASSCARAPRPKVLDALLDETGAAAIYATRGYEPWEAKLEQRHRRALQAA